MNRDGHMATGVATGALVGITAGSGSVVALVCTGIGGVAALLPDIDHHGSTITHKLGPLGTFLSWVARKISLAVYTLTKSPTDTPAAGGEHRGLTHTAVAAVINGGLLWLLLDRVAGVESAFAYGLALAVGIVTHIVGDAITAQGVPLFWPLPIRGERWYAWHVPLIKISCGGPAEKVIAFLSWCVAIGLLVLSGLAQFTDLVPPLSELFGARVLGIGHG